MQRNFTKRLPGLCNLNYIDRLRICYHESLEFRRIRSDMCFVYKLLHSFTVSSNIHKTRSNCFKLKKTHGHLIIRLNHFVIRCANNCNLLNNNIVCFHIILKCLRNVYCHLINLLLKGML